MKNHAPYTILAFGMAIMAVSAILLREIDQHRELGKPGLVMIKGDVFDDKGRLISTNTIALPNDVLDYTSVVARVTSGELSVLPDDTVFARRVYSDTNGFSLLNSVVMMGTDRTSIHKPQFCLTGQGWKVQSESEDEIQIGGDISHRLPVWKMVAEQPQKFADGSERMVRAIYVYWFVADGYVTARHSQRMWWMAKELLATGRLQRWAYVSVFAACLPGQEEETYEKMKQFIAASVPHYHHFDEHTIFSGATQ